MKSQFARVAIDRETTTDQDYECHGGEEKWLRPLPHSDDHRCLRFSRQPLDEESHKHSADQRNRPEPHGAEHSQPIDLACIEQLGSHGRSGTEGEEDGDHHDNREGGV